MHFVLFCKIKRVLLVVSGENSLGNKKKKRKYKFNFSFCQIQTNIILMTWQPPQIQQQQLNKKPIHLRQAVSTQALNTRQVRTQGPAHGDRARGGGPAPRRCQEPRRGICPPRSRAISGAELDANRGSWVGIFKGFHHSPACRVTSPSASRGNKRPRLPTSLGKRCEWAQTGQRSPPHAP